jgi:hypothetical protein
LLPPLRLLELRGTKLKPMNNELVFIAAGHGVNNKQAGLAGAQQHIASSACCPALKDDSPIIAHASKASKAARTAMIARTHSWTCKPGWVTRQEAGNSASQILFET